VSDIQVPEEDPAPIGPPLNATIRNREVILGSPNTRARLDAPFRSGVFVSATTPLSPEEESLLAGASRQPISEVQAQRKNGQPVIIQAGLGSSAARASLQEHQSLGLPAEILEQWSVLKTITYWGMSTLLASTSVALGLGAGFVGLYVLGSTIALGVAGTIGFICAPIVVITAIALALRHRQRIQMADGSWDMRRTARTERESSAQLTQCWEDIFSIRKQLADSHLPEIAIRDIRSALDDLEESLVTFHLMEPDIKTEAAQTLSVALQDIAVQLAPDNKNKATLEASLRKLSLSAAMGKEATRSARASEMTSSKFDSA
jgi:hypothetical protein